MKTQKTIFTKMSFFSIFLFMVFTFNIGQAQTNNKSVTGTIIDSYGAIEDVNIVLKGTRTGTTTNENGKFIFPKTLNEGDVLVVSYLGYKTQNITIAKNTQNLKILLKEDVIEVAGALNGNQPFKSSRKK